MPLSALLHATIARRGPLPFRDFMEQALYHPEHGYYASGRAAIGRGGDFFTSVSVGPLFGRLLARQFAEMWERLGCPAEFTIVEQGAHRGDFARDALGGLRDLAPGAFAATRYRIIEPSAWLASEQRVLLQEFSDRVEWTPDVGDLASFTGVHFSNELIDAFPVHLVTWTGSEWLERHVASVDGGFGFVDAPLSSSVLAAHLARLPPVPPGYVTEVNLAAAPWLTAVAARLRRGFVLAFDYGYSRLEYYRPERVTGTLSAYAAHQRQRDPLARPGEIDLTAHVDFTTLAEQADALGLTLAGFTDQHHFMAGVSPLHFPDEPATTPERQKELRALQTLMHPTQMGRAFKTLCLSREVAPVPALAGFRFARDARGVLLGGHPA